MASLRDAAFTSSYAYQQLVYLTENIGPRMAGSPQAEFATQYVANQLRQLSLDVHLEDVRVPRWVRGLESAELVEYSGQAPGTTQKIVVTAPGGSSDSGGGHYRRPDRGYQLPTAAGDGLGASGG